MSYKDVAGYIYVIRSGDSSWYKIGKTANHPVARLKSLQTGSPVELRLCEVFWVYDVDEVEYKAHQAFDGKRIRGEWFELNKIELQQLWTLLTMLKYPDEPTYFEYEYVFEAHEGRRQGLNAKVAAPLEIGQSDRRKTVKGDKHYSVVSKASSLAQDGR